MNGRVETLHTLITVIVVAYVVLVERALAKLTLFDAYTDQGIALLTSIGLYRLLVRLLFWFANRTNWILRLLWGREYINGIWVYSYEINGEQRYGLWRMNQDLFGVSITGYGLDKNKKIRSTFRSITPLINNNGLYEITFLRSLVAAPEEEHIAKTTFYLDTFKNGKLHAPPKVIRSQSIIFGGAETGTKHVAVVARKQEAAKTEDEILSNLKT